MPKPRLVKITAWSYSRFQDYEKCPQLAKYKTIDKLKEPDSNAGDRGTRIHALASAWATNKLPQAGRENAAYYADMEKMLKAKKIPEELETFEDEFAALRKLPRIEIEAEWCFDKDWQVTGWFDWNAWLRVKVDTHHLVVKKKGKIRETSVEIIDYKTGKKHDDHELQRTLYALGAFLMYPDAVSVKVSHWYLDLGQEQHSTYKAKEFEQLKADWLRRTTAMLNDTSFVPRVNAGCRYCHFRKGNGGPCRY